MSNELEAQIEFLKGEADALRLQLRDANRLLAATRAELHAPPLEQQRIFTEAEAMIPVRILDTWQAGDELRRWWTRKGECILQDGDGKHTRYTARSRDRARDLAAEACLERDPALAERVVLDGLP